MKRYSLYALAFVFFVILIGVNFASIYFTITQHRGDLVETAIKEKTHLAETINEILASPIWIYRLALVPGMEKAFISEIAGFEDVRYIRVVSSDGTIYKSSIEGEWGEIIKDPDISKVISTRKEVVKDQIFKEEKIKLIIYPGYQDKTIWVAFTLKGIEEVIGEMWIRDIIVTLGALLFFLLVLFVILRRIINPIREITLACEEVRRGNLDIKIKVESRTEIGELAVTFNKTIADLRKSKEALEEAKITLEIRVEARTKELKELTLSLNKQVKERTKELQEKMTDLERFQGLAVGRELKMIELKEEIEKLKKELEKRSKNKN